MGQLGCYTNNVPLLDVQGPITIAHARQLNLQVSSFLGSYFANMENRLLTNDVLMLRNLGDVVEPVGGRLGGGEGQPRCPSRVGGPVQFEFESALACRTFWQ